MVKKILILPYFGSFPCYFKLWLQSCAMNPGVDFLIITDNPPPSSVPSNVKWVEKSFECLKQDFQNKLGFMIWLKRPYKLCDFKGFYGYLFAEYLKGYDFWGYCDCDVIFGDLDKFLPESLFLSYDKILRTGHLSFVRNTKQINENFLRYDTHKVVLKSPVMYAYDEAVDGYRKGLAGELIDQGYRFYQNDALPADIDFRHFPFRIVTAPETCCVFEYAEGKLYKLFRENGKVSREEVIYVHLQKRKMQISDEIQTDHYLIYPNEFTLWDEHMPEGEEFWEKVSAEKPGYFDFKQERRNERIRDVRRFFYEPRKLACLRYRFQK